MKRPVLLHGPFYFEMIFLEVSYETQSYYMNCKSILGRYSLLAPTK